MKRRRWKKKAVALALVVLAILALLLARCTGAFGFGSSGDGTESEPRALVSTETTSTARAPTVPCEVRVDGAGTHVAGASCPIEDVAARCASARAQLIVTGDARHGDAEAVRERLRAASIEILELDRGR